MFYLSHRLQFVCTFLTDPLQAGLLCKQHCPSIKRVSQLVISFLQIFKTGKSKDQKFWKGGTRCQMSSIMSHISYATCHVSSVASVLELVGGLCVIKGDINFPVLSVSQNIEETSLLCKIPPFTVTFDPMGRFRCPWRFRFS